MKREVEPLNIDVESWWRFIVEEIRLIGVVASAAMTIAACSITIVKPVKKALARVSGANKVQLAILRNSITTTYYEYLHTKKLPIYIRENLILLNEAYVESGGDHYIDMIMNDMLQWEILEK